MTLFVKFGLMNTSRTKAPMQQQGLSGIALFMTGVHLDKVAGPTSLCKGDVQGWG